MDVTEPQWHAGRKTKLCDYLEHVLTFMWHHPVGEACACPMKHTPALRLRTRRTDKGITEATSLIAKCQLQAMAPQQWPEEPSCSHQLQLCQHDALTTHWVKKESCPHTVRLDYSRPKAYK